jgi:hypothetical protein
LPGSARQRSSHQYEHRQQASRSRALPWSGHCTRHRCKPWHVCRLAFPLRPG